MFVLYYPTVSMRDSGNSMFKVFICWAYTCTGLIIRDQNCLLRLNRLLNLSFILNCPLHFVLNYTVRDNNTRLYYILFHFIFFWGRGVLSISRNALAMPVIILG